MDSGTSFPPVLKALLTIRAVSPFASNVSKLELEKPDFLSRIKDVTYAWAMSEISS